MQVVLDILKAFFTIIKWPLAAVAAVLVLLGLCCAIYGVMAYRKGSRLKKGEHIHVPKALLEKLLLLSAETNGYGLFRS